jgi:DNA repair photolyase
VTRRHYVDIKTAIRKEALADTFSVSAYRCSPYGACAHACAYCDGRAEKYHVEGEFASDITVRQNLADVLARDLEKLREIAPIGIGSGITDAYQPIEEEERLMRRAAEILAERDFPVSLMTKSSLVLRDLDLWRRVNQRGGFILMVSLTFAEDGDREVFEPGASSVEERLEALRAFKEAGCAVGVLMMPLLPGISDTTENLVALADRLRPINPDFVMPGSLTLRPGRQKAHFFSVLARSYPELLERYRDLYAKELVSGNPSWAYRQDFARRVPGFFSEFNPLQPHRVYRDRMPIYNEIHVLMGHMAELYRDRGVDTRALEAAHGRYAQWITAEKRNFNRRRSLPPGTLDRTLTDLARGSGWEELLDNERLAAFLRRVIFDREVFDYLSLELGPAQG